jgi:hypothetical protein
MKHRVHLGSTRHREVEEHFVCHKKIVCDDGQWRTEGGGSNPPLKFRNFDKVPKIKKILLYEMKFVVPNYSCLQNP